jgi:hypothetical protein
MDPTDPPRPLPHRIMSYRKTYPFLASALLILSWGCSASRTDTRQPPGATPRPEENLPAPPGRGSVQFGAADQVRYRLDSRDSIAMEMPDGSFQRTVTVKTTFLTLSLRPRGEAFSADILLDSMILDRANPILQPLVDSARGTRWQGVIQKTGRLDSIAASKASVFGEQVRAMLQRLIPIIPAEGAEAGQRWEDRTNMPYQIMAGFAAMEDRTAGFRAERWENEDGRRVLRIESSMNYTVSGSGSGFGQEIRFEGTGVAQGVHRMSASGVLTSAQVSDSVRMTLTVPAVGQSVPTVVVTTYSLGSMP